MVGAIVSYTYIGLLLMIAPTLEKYGKENSRKFVHIMTSNWWFIVMIYFEDIFWPLMISVSFVVVNVMTYKYSIFKSIERAGKNKDKGTIYYAITLVALVCMSYLYKDLYIGLLGSLIMGYADGFAAIVGKAMNWHPYYIRGGKKSLAGNLVMFGITTMISWGILGHLGNRYNFVAGIMVGLVATLVETISVKGIDNLTVPISAVMIYLVLMK